MGTRTGPSQTAASPRLTDPAAFRLLYARMFPIVYAYCFRRCGGNVAVAEDLTQETFLAVVDATRRGIDAGDAWVIGIARHKFLDHCRRESRFSRIAARLRFGVRDAHDRPWIDAATRQTWLQRLRGCCRNSERPWLCIISIGLPVVEVARALGRSEPATESLLVRAKKAFRDIVEEMGDA
jgi:RNA polymerase sigma-70 factor (ECF subfamily)